MRSASATWRCCASPTLGSPPSPLAATARATSCAVGPVDRPVVAAGQELLHLLLHLREHRLHAGGVLRHARHVGQARREHRAQLLGVDSGQRALAALAEQGAQHRGQRVGLVVVAAREAADRCSCAPRLVLGARDGPVSSARAGPTPLAATDVRGSTRAAADGRSPVGSHRRGAGPEGRRASSPDAPAAALADQGRPEAAESTDRRARTREEARVSRDVGRPVADRARAAAPARRPAAAARVLLLVSLFASVLLVAVAALLPVPYVVLRQGPALDTLSAPGRQAADRDQRPHDVPDHRAAST